MHLSMHVSLENAIHEVSMESFYGPNVAYLIILYGQKYYVLSILFAGTIQRT